MTCFTFFYFRVLAFFFFRSNGMQLFIIISCVLFLFFYLLSFILFSCKGYDMVSCSFRSWIEWICDATRILSAPFMQTSEWTSSPRPMSHFMFSFIISMSMLEFLIGCKFWQLQIFHVKVLHIQMRHFQDKVFKIYLYIIGFAFYTMYKMYISIVIVVSVLIS